MQDIINERIKIIEEFVPLYKWKGKTQEKKDKSLKLYSSMEYSFAIALITVVLAISLRTSLGAESMLVGESRCLSSDSNVIICKSSICIYRTNPKKTSEKT